MDGHVVDVRQGGVTNGLLYPADDGVKRNAPQQERDGAAHPKAAGLCPCSSQSAHNASCDD
eukprot:12901688-Prorocentrum_lima.AAC.1